MKKTTSTFVDIIRGMVIGIANIIPGVSGGTMMVSMGIYDQLIYSITHLFSDWKKVWRFLLPIGIGIVLAILLLSKLFEFLLTHYPIPTNLGFCGLILGSLPFIFQNVKHKGFSAWDFAAFAAFFILIVGLSFVEEKSGADVTLQLNLPGIFMLFIVGVITAATMVIPGVSGSMILMLMGYYQPILSTISSAIDALLHFDLPHLMYCAGLMIPFAIGVAVGVFLIAKVIEWIFARWKTQAYWAIIGLITASPIAILMKTSWAGFSIVQLIIGIVCLFAGALAAYRLSEL